MPAAEVVVDTALVRRLLRAQHPDLAGRTLRRLGTGWDNEVFRLGPDLTVRMPRRALGAELIATELRWLPALSPQLPLPTPEPVRRGSPTSQYPYPWAISRYVPGRAVGADPLVAQRGALAARDLAGFLRALRRPAPSEAPRNPHRGVPLAEKSDRFDAAARQLPVDLRDPVRGEWARVLEVSAHQGRPCWVHGDLHGLNVLVVRGRISGVIDFGDLCAGDPATDLACAWLLLDAPGRSILRDLLGSSDDEWARGRGWGLYLAVMFLAHGEGSALNAAIGARGLQEVLAAR